MTNEQYETVIQTRTLRRYQPYEGKIVGSLGHMISQFSKLNRELITPKQLETVRLNGLEADKQYLGASDICVNVAVILNFLGDEVKYVHNHPLIRCLDSICLFPHSGFGFKNGALLPLTESEFQEQYDTPKGFVLSKSQLREFRNDHYALPKKRREFWEFLAEGDTTLAKDYEKNVCGRLGLTFNKVMGLWMPRYKGLRLLSMGAIDCRRRSNVYGNILLDEGSNLLIRVVPEELVSQKTLEAKLD